MARFHYDDTLRQLEFPMLTTLVRGSSIKYVPKIFRKTNISNPLIRTRTCAYQRFRNVSFSENSVYVLNEWSLRCITLVMTLSLPNIYYELFLKSSFIWTQIHIRNFVCILSLFKSESIWFVHTYSINL